LDWKQVFRDVSTDPERLKNLPQELREASKNFGVDLPLSKLPDIGKGASSIKQLDQLKKQILKGITTPAPATKVPKKVPKTGAKQVEEKQAPAPADPLKTLKDLIKR
jgi:hypothetical protein